MKKGRKSSIFHVEFNGRTYERASRIYELKEDAKRQQKIEHNDGFNAIVDKNKEGYFLWVSVGKRDLKKKK